MLDYVHVLPRVAHGYRMDIAAIRRHRWELLRFRVTEAVSGRGHAIRIARVIRDLVLSERSTPIVKLYGSQSHVQKKALLRLG